MAGDRELRLSRRSHTIDLDRGWVFWIAFTLFARWLWRRIKPICYHPVALAGCVVFSVTYLLSAWVTLGLIACVALWALLAPASYLRHVQPRIDSFKAGWRYRHRPRRKLKANGLINDEDPTPTVSHVAKIGCTTKVRIKMSHGDDIDYWRERSTRIAQTYGALDCKINAYRRETLKPGSHEMVTLPRWLELEFLTKDPFNSPMGVEFIDYHRAPTLNPAVSVTRNGQPHHHTLAAHLLRVAMTRWGKSNAIRAMIYAQKDNIRDGLVELWGIDGKGGVEQSMLRHVFTRVAYGDKDPAEFARLLRDAVAVMKRRQRRMRGFHTEHIPTPQEPWLLIVIDELLTLTSKAIPPAIRNDIAASIMLIQQMGLACGVSLDASTQLAQKELISFRDGFTQFELGKVERGAVDMIFGAGWWQMGVRADEIADDLKGVFYKKTDSTMTPEQIRYPQVEPADVSEKSLGFKVGKSVLWSKPVMPEGMPMGGEPKPEPELAPVVSAGRLTDL